MQRHSWKEPLPPAHRHGFTMLELLVVIGIIALLMSSFALVLANFFEAAKLQATRATIAKINTILNQRIEAVRNQDLTDVANRLVGANVVSSVEAGRALALKRILRANFPQRRGDIVQGTANPAAPFATLTDTWVTANQNAESAAFLYLALTKGPTYGTPTVDDSAFLASETATVDGVTYFIDAWGQPLRFYRAPTRLFWQGEDDDLDGTLDRTPTTNELAQYQRVRRILAPRTDFSTAGSLIHPLRIDPDDRLYRLRNILVVTAPNIDLTTWQNFEASFQTPATFSTPLVISAGADRVLGLFEPWETGTTGEGRCKLLASIVAANDPTLLDPLTDSVTNLNQQSLGGN